MLRFGRGSRLQQVILDKFPPESIRTSPIWNLNQFEPDADRRKELQWLIARFGVSERDFLRWRNACVTPDLKTSIKYLRNGSTPTPIWVTSHIIRRNVGSARHASLAAHLALVSATASENLTRGHEVPLMLALGHITCFNYTHALPSLVSQVLALPDNHHARILRLLSNRALTPSPLIAAVLQRVIYSTRTNRILLPRKLWLSLWKRWGESEPLGEEFSTWLEKRIREQGVAIPFARSPSSKMTHTAGATYSQLPAQSRIDPRLASVTAATQATTVSANLLLGMAHVLVVGFYPDELHSEELPNAAFLTTLIQGLVQRKAYGRALAVWEDAERKIASSSVRAEVRSDTKRRNFRQKPSSRLNSLSAIARSSSAPSPPLAFTAPLLEIGLSTYAKSGDPLRALQILDEHVRLPRQRERTSSRFQKTGPSEKPTLRGKLAPSVLNEILEALPPRAQHLIFTYSFKRWGIQPDATAFEIVMRDTARLVRHGASSAVNSTSGDLNGETSFGANVRQFRDGLRQLFGRVRAHETQGTCSSTIASSD